MEWLWVIPCHLGPAVPQLGSVCGCSPNQAYSSPAAKLNRAVWQPVIAGGRVMRMGFVKAVLQIFALCSLAAQGYLKQHLLLRSHSCYTSLDPILLLLQTSSSFGLVV